MVFYDVLGCYAGPAKHNFAISWTFVFTHILAHFWLPMGTKEA